jgi:GNAT superfamily N-acetyltransferase
MDDWTIEQLNRSHDRTQFCCGKTSLDQYLQTRASQDEKRRMGRTYVALRPGDKRVYGYYTLAAGTIPFENLPPGPAKKLPKHPVPVILLARLAVDQSTQGQGLGGHLLGDALKRSVTISKTLGAHAVRVDALDEEARAFYEHYGFISLLDNRLHLFLPIATIEPG